MNIVIKVNPENGKFQVESRKPADVKWENLKGIIVNIRETDDYKNKYGRSPYLLRSL